MTDSTDHYDLQVFMSRPLHPERYTGERRRLWNTIVAQAGREPLPYTGEIVALCEECVDEIGGGPNTASAVAQCVENGIDFQQLCFLCVHVVAETMGSESPDGFSVDVANLGNDEHGYNADTAAQHSAGAAFGLGVAQVATDPTRFKYQIACLGCGRVASLPNDPGRKVGICPDCMRSRT